LFIAGEAAHRDQNEEVALQEFSAARESAHTADQQLDALWGQLLSAAALEHPSAKVFLDQLDAWPADTAVVELRRASARHVYGTRFGSLEGAQDALRKASPFLEKEEDPFVRSSFRIIFAHTLALAGLYEEALCVAAELTDDMTRYRLNFGRAPGCVIQAYAEAGLRRYSCAEALLDQAQSEPGVDFHTLANARCLRARMLLTRKKYDRALALLHSDLREPVEAATRAEHLGTRALALACRGDLPEALEAATAASKVSSGAEARLLVAVTKAVVALQQNSPRADNLAIEAFRLAITTQVIDGLVCGYRAFPPLLIALARDLGTHAELAEILRAAKDERVGVKLHILEDSSTHRLSKREQQVYELLAEGKKNREIAQLLFITEATAKAHVRSVRQKLGLRSRVEAAIHASYDREGGIRD